MTASVALLFATLAASRQNPAISAQDVCTDSLTRGISATTGEFCLAEGELKRADAAPRENAARTRAMRAAEDHYKRAQALATAAADKERALEGLAVLYDTQYLNEPALLEGVLLELMNLAPGGRATVRVGGGVKPRQTVGPRMPQEAIAAGVQGIVILELVINEEGVVSNVKVLRSIPLLDRAAIDAARQWRFAPTLLNGRPVSVTVTSVVNFTRPR